MKEIIAYCGLNCHGCPIYLATREENAEKRDEMRAEIARQIKDLYGVEHQPRDINDCDGCTAQTGRLFSGCKTCKIRKCARGKGVESCAHCNQYACEELKKFFSLDPDARMRLEKIRRAF